MVKPKPFSPKPWVKQGYVKEAPTIAALAAKFGLDPAVLEKTVEDFNRYADAGKDPDFARGENYYSAYMGDALRSEEHTSELQSLMRISYAVFCLKKKNKR